MTKRKSANEEQATIADQIEALRVGAAKGAISQAECDEQVRMLEQESEALREEEADLESQAWEDDEQLPLIDVDPPNKKELLALGAELNRFRTVRIKAQAKELDAEERLYTLILESDIPPTAKAPGGRFAIKGLEFRMPNQSHKVKVKEKKE